MRSSSSLMVTGVSKVEREGAAESGTVEVSAILHDLVLRLD